MTGSPVHLVREDADVTAPTVEVDPAASIVHMTGTADAPVNVGKGRMLGSFEQVDINLQSNEMSFLRGLGTGRK